MCVVKYGHRWENLCEDALYNKQKAADGRKEMYPVRKCLN